MKTTPMFLVLALTLGATSAAFAGDKTQDKQTTKEKPANTQPAPKAQTHSNPAGQKEQTALTGSYIKGGFKRTGMITDGFNPVYVLDHQAVQTSGASDLSQVLLRKGFRR